jgi:tetrahydromethanopterin S-methyltransferase subunit G
MLKINHPQVYIYSYQLSRESATEANSIWNWASHIWQHFNVKSGTIFSKDIGYPLSKAQKFPDSTNKIEGSLRFCILDDSEGILARIGCPETDENKDLEITEVKEFNPNNLIIPNSYQDWLGQTILIVYKSKTYQEPSKSDLRQVANECLKYLFSETSQIPSFYRDSELFNSHIFEYSSIQSQLQIFVYRIDDDIEQKLGSILQPLFELFYHRHKITKAFIDSCKTINLAHEYYEKIQNHIENLERKLDSKESEYFKELKANIKQLLRDQLEYQKLLQFLEDIDNTISIHIYNYQQKLSEICDKCQLQPEKLTTFNLFIEKTVPYIQRQIKGDLGYLQHGTNLIDTAIASIRGIVEIEQAESDRLWQEQEKDRDHQLQTLIAVVGVGIGVAGVTATAFPYYLKPPDSPPKLLFPGNYSPHPVTQSISISLGIGLLASVGVWVLIQLWRTIFKK